MKTNLKPVLIMGPTGAGKSALAQTLAIAWGAVVINADASQVYRDLRILSARPSVEAERAAPHALYGFVDASVRYSAGQWRRDVTSEINAAHARGRPAIVVGGSGLYFKALTEGLVDMPPIPPEVRARLAEALAGEGLPALHARLAREDRERIRPTDTARILRALEVQIVTGAPLHAARRAAAPALDDWLGVALTPDRERLYRRLERRFDAMLAEGALEETRALIQRDLDPSLPAMKALGVGPLGAYLKGEIALHEATERAKRDTRRYAKRQFTWIGGQMGGWVKLKEEELGARRDAVMGLL